MRWASPLLCAALFAAADGTAWGNDLATRAQHGDPAAMFQLATMYDLGEWGGPDASLAFEWYQRAAAAGLSDAEFNVAVMLDSGRGVAQDLAEAATWYGRAAARGNHRAQYNLALLYNAGTGVPHNAAFAAFWLRKAALGLSAAAPRIATLRPDEQAASLSAAVPAAPLQDVAAGTAPVEFVWTAAAQPEPVRYMIEVQTLGRVGSIDVRSQFTDGSAVTMDLRKRPGEYAWRVSTLGRDAARYAVSGWTHFTVLSRPSMGAPSTE